MASWKWIAAAATQELGVLLDREGVEVGCITQTLVELVPNASWPREVSGSPRASLEELDSARLALLAQLEDPGVSSTSAGSKSGSVSRGMKFSAMAFRYLPVRRHEREMASEVASPACCCRSGIWRRSACASAAPAHRPGRRSRPGSGGSAGRRSSRRSPLPGLHGSGAGSGLQRATRRSAGVTERWRHRTLRAGRGEGQQASGGDSVALGHRCYFWSANLRVFMARTVTPLPSFLGG